MDPSPSDPSRPWDRSRLLYLIAASSAAVGVALLIVDAFTHQRIVHTAGMYLVVGGALLGVAVRFRRSVNDGPRQRGEDEGSGPA